MWFSFHLARAVTGWDRGRKNQSEARCLRTRIHQLLCHQGPGNFPFPDYAGVEVLHVLRTFCPGSPSGWTDVSSLPEAFGCVDLHHCRRGPCGTDCPEHDPVNHGGFLRDSQLLAVARPLYASRPLGFHVSEILQCAQMSLIASLLLQYPAYSYNLPCI